MHSIRQQHLDHQAIRTQMEEKRPSVEQSLETGRLYLREEGLEDKRLSTDSGEGGCIEEEKRAM